MVASVDLLVPEMGRGDATSNHTRLLRDLLRQRGVAARIIVGRRARADDYELLANRWRAGADLTILQHTIGSEIAQRIIGLQAPVVVNYHNITPPEFVEAWNPEQVRGLEWGRSQLHQLAPLTIRGIADSRFNARELDEAGVRDVVVVPVLRQLAGAGLRGGPDPPDRRAVGATVLFVGRITPNKCQHDLISAVAALSRSRPVVRLVLVGGSAPNAYLQCLRNLAVRLGIGDQVVFTGEVSEDCLLQWYRQADVFACASEHEGFGVPLVEAMACGVPVVAYGAAAVSETVGGAGIVLCDKRPATLAAALNRVLSDGPLRAQLREAGAHRAAHLGIAAGGREMWDAIKDLISISGRPATEADPERTQDAPTEC